MNEPHSPSRRSRIAVVAATIVSFLGVAGVGGAAAAPQGAPPKPVSVCISVPAEPAGQTTPKGPGTKTGSSSCQSGAGVQPMGIRGGIRW
jgi:hypothetical protein